MGTGRIQYRHERCYGNPYALKTTICWWFPLMTIKLKAVNVQKALHYIRKLHKSETARDN